jgi:hypothetical protein
MFLLSSHEDFVNAMREIFSTPKIILLYVCSSF